MKDGTSQKDRITPALETGYIDVDEMRFEDLLAMAADFSHLLTYYNLENQPNGDWSPFFVSNEAVIFAVIQTLDLKKAETAFYAFMNETAWDSGIRLGRNLFTSQEQAWKTFPNYRLVKKLDTWHKQLKTPESEAGLKLRQEIGVGIESYYGKGLSQLLRFFSQYGEGISTRIQSDFQGNWFAATPSQTVPTPSDDPSAIFSFLKSNFYIFHNAIFSLKASAKRLLPLSLESRNHPPSLGLYIAFIRLFQKAQENLNTFQGRHLDFYYNKVLKVQGRDRIPDSTYLIFHPTKEGKPVFIRKNTAFTAGLDDRHQDILYTTDTDLFIKPAEIVSLRTLYFARNPYSSPENSLGYITAVKENEIPILESTLAASDNASGESGPEDRKSWPLFGAPQNHAEGRQYRNASFGFAIASPVLFLKEGEREIDLSIKMLRPASEAEDATENGFNAEMTLDEVLDLILKKMKEETGDFKPQTENEGHAFFFKVFAQIFRIELSTETGWLSVDDYLPLCHLLDPRCEKDALKIRLNLSPEIAAIVAYQPEIHGPGYETQLPVLRLTMNPKAYLFPYSLLLPFIVKEVRIDVSVKEVRELLLYNNLGRLDPNSPFNPFGPLPSVGSYFIVGNAEMARKKITSFETQLEWGDLPREKGGFETYYKAYPEAYHNASFKARITTLNGSRWLPFAEEAQPETALFKTERCNTEDSDLIDKHRTLSCKAVVEFFKPTQQRNTDKPFSYTPEIKGGFFKFTLSAPDTGFGHKAYPNLLTQVLTLNARLKKPAFFKPVPNAPYTPLVNAISINYKAVAKLNLRESSNAQDAGDEGQFFHIHPFGHESLSSTSYRHIHLLPRYSEAGYLFIGLSEAPTGSLTLFFHLKEDTTPETGSAPSHFIWSYLASNRWYILNPYQVVSDTTGGFLTSGIVTLKIPGTIEQGNTIMPEKPYWLRVSVAEHPERLCSVYAIHTHAAKVTRQAEHTSSFHSGENLAAGTIKAPLKSIPGIGEVKQIVKSFGGRHRESADHIKKRINERLRHKNRATTPWDYERLILEKFPEIFKVKCFANMVEAEEAKNRIRPGHLLIIVIPQRPKSGSDTPSPIVNGAILKEIQTYAKKLSSPFARLSVRNPAYEQIQVRCTVKLKMDHLSGHHVELLNQEISDYLSPWSDTGYHAGFGWAIRRYELEAFIRNRVYIDYVTNFSMLHLTQNGQGEYVLFDSADGEESKDRVEEIRPYFPWSLPMPLKKHYIETIDKVESIPPDVTGIDELEIGSTFIIKQR